MRARACVYEHVIKTKKSYDSKFSHYNKTFPVASGNITTVIRQDRNLVSYE